MSPVRVLLVWPGTDGAAAGNFGVPQLVTIASYLRAKTNAVVEIVDLYAERALGPVDLERLLSGTSGSGFDVVGFSCYSSYDFLLVDALATVVRRVLPQALLVAGGYHVSARPAELLEAGFDVAVVGEGEKPMVRIVESVAGGAPLRGVILGPEPIEDLDDLAPSDWSYLERYRSVLGRVAPQVQLYLSRGCPFDCAFCMERAKREVSWRAFSVERAIDELRRLRAFMDLSGSTLYVADALFGMRKSWRREFLAQLARERLAVQKIWLLIRVDMIDEEDLQAFAAANCALGFGLESGDPQHLATIRKAGRLDDYLDTMRYIAARSRELDLPWGANVIVGHPGETEATLRASARYLSELFLDERGTTGFLSVDPFRLYPGSPIDDERGAWEARFGARFHRPSWWHDGDQEFLSEWVDPSHDLDYRKKTALAHQLLAPILRQIGDRFVYRGPARDYFRRAIDEQVAHLGSSSRLHCIGRYYAWKRYLGRGREAEHELASDAEAASLLREARQATVARVGRDLDPGSPEAGERLLASDVGRALVEVPRERFVALDVLRESVADVALPLGESEHASVSAMHAYVRSYDLARIARGARVLDVGGGSGYGAALLSRLVGEGGKVVTVEIEPRLASRARALLEGLSVHVMLGDALEPATLAAAQAHGGGSFDAIVCGFAIDELPAAWGSILREGGIAVAPVKSASSQWLTRAIWRCGAFSSESFDEVSYHGVRRREDVPQAREPGPRQASRRLLPVAG
jgi:protein-L-isoaspartate(D-aspartate) O-methyltransferase